MSECKEKSHKMVKPEEISDPKGALVLAITEQSVRSLIKACQAVARDTVESYKLAMDVSINIMGNLCYVAANEEDKDKNMLRLLAVQQEHSNEWFDTVRKDLEEKLKACEATDLAPKGE